MLFTRETDYAIRFFRALQDGKQHSVSEITEQEMVPQQFAYKILRKLSKAGLVDVTRGAKGGCRLAIELGDISVLELIGIVEAKASFVACLDPNFDCPYRDQNGCQVHQNLSVVEKKIAEELQGLSVKDLLNEDLAGIVASMESHEEKEI